MNTYDYLIWIVFGALIGFVASFIFGNLLSLPLDLSYLFYFVLIGIFFIVYVRKSQVHKGLKNLDLVSRKEFEDLKEG